MFLPILLIHLILFLIPLVHFTPFNSKADPNYKSLFLKVFPKISILCIVFPAIFITYTLIFIYLSPITYIDSFDKVSVYICTVIFTIITLSILIKLVYSEMKNADFRITEYKYVLIPSIYLYLYTSSVLFSITFIAFTNNVLDFSKGEEHISTIVHGQYKSDGLEQKHNIDIEPDIYGIKNIKISGLTFDKIRVRSKAKKSTEKSSYMTEEVKIKAYVYKGLYGVRYIGKNMDVIK